MIRKLDSDLESFKTLEFFKGLNILLADKSEGATDRQSRNGVGKTSFVDTVHFLTGGTAGEKSIFRSKALIDSVFDIQMNVGGEEFTVERSGTAPSKIYVNGPVEDWPIQPKFDEDRDVHEISNTNWCHTLGAK